MIKNKNKNLSVSKHWKMYDITPRPKKSNEEITLDIIKGGMEAKFGIEFETFLKTYNEMISGKPEKLI